MANITVKNQANADVIYVNAVPSAGDKSPARWTQDAASAIHGFRPVFQVMTRDNGAKNARVMEGSLKFPIIETIEGRPTQTALVPFSFSVTLPTNVDANLVAEAFHQAGNLLVSTLIRQVAVTGFAPT
jgi:hypothetical protein